MALLNISDNIPTQMNMLRVNFLTKYMGLLTVFNKSHVMIMFLRSFDACFEGYFMSLPNCPKCQSEYTYEDSDLLVCPECAHQWKEGEVFVADDSVLDAHGNVLNDGDTVSVLKDLRVKGSASTVKMGTKVKNIRLLPHSGDGHNIDCKIDGFGAMKLKSEYVKKV